MCSGSGKIRSGSKALPCLFWSYCSSSSLDPKSLCVIIENLGNCIPRNLANLSTNKSVAAQLSSYSHLCQTSDLLPGHLYKAWPLLTALRRHRTPCWPPPTLTLLQPSQLLGGGFWSIFGVWSGLLLSLCPLLTTSCGFFYHARYLRLLAALFTQQQGVSQQ